MSGGFPLRESLTHNKLGGGNSNIVCDFHPGSFGEDESNLTGAYFSNGLVQPPTITRIHELKKTWNVLGYIPHGRSTWLTVPKR